MTSETLQVIILIELKKGIRLLTKTSNYYFEHLEAGGAGLTSEA